MQMFKKADKVHSVRDDGVLEGVLFGVRLFAISQTVVPQAPVSLGFSRQEHWSGLPFPSPMHESEK